MTKSSEATPPPTLPEFIQQKMGAAQITPARLSDMTKISLDQICRHLNGTRPISVSAAVLIGEAIGLDPVDMLRIKAAHDVFEWKHGKAVKGRRVRRAMPSPA